MPQCAVATCRNSHRRTRGRRIRYHRFPQIPEVRSRWVRACGRTPLANGDIPFNIQTARICSLHFSNDSYEKDMEHLVLGLPVRSRLRRGAVPTIGVPVEVQPVTKMLVENAKRNLLKSAHYKMLGGEKKGAKNGGLSKAQQKKLIEMEMMKAETPKTPTEKEMTGIDILLALGLKPTAQWVWLIFCHIVRYVFFRNQRVERTLGREEGGWKNCLTRVPFTFPHPVWLGVVPSL